MCDWLFGLANKVAIKAKKSGCQKSEHTSDGPVHYHLLDYALRGSLVHEQLLEQGKSRSQHTGKGLSVSYLLHPCSCCLGGIIGRQAVAAVRTALL